MGTTINFRKWLLVTGIILLLYFLFLVYNSYSPVDHAGFLQFFAELLTIPFLLMLLFSFFFSLVKLFKKEHWKEYALIFTINLATVLLLIFATYAESAK